MPQAKRRSCVCFDVVKSVLMRNIPRRPGGLEQRKRGIVGDDVKNGRSHRMLNAVVRNFCILLREMGSHWKVLSRGEA